MNVYAESSAVLSWLYGEEDGDEVAGVLVTAEAVLASRLTLAECERALVRGAALGRWSEADVQERQRLLAATTEGWQALPIDEAILERSGRPFPLEPVRTPDAIHLATALAARTLAPGVAFLSVDRRCRDNASRLGFRVLPEPAGEVMEEAPVYGTATASRRAVAAGRRRSPTARPAGPRRRQRARPATRRG